MDEDEIVWPRHDVTCTTPGCANQGIPLPMPDNGHPTYCGVCGQQID